LMYTLKQIYSSYSSPLLLNLAKSLNFLILDHFSYKIDFTVSYLSTPSVMLERSSRKMYITVVGSNDDLHSKSHLLHVRY
jgi:hypothetical protein